MSEFIINTIILMYGDGLASKCADWMDKIWNVIVDIFNAGLVDNAFTAFASVSAALLLLYFLMDMTSQASKELLTLEKFVIMSIKYVIAIVILLNASVLMQGVVTIGQSLYNTAATVELKNIEEEGTSTYSSYKAGYDGDDNAAKEAMVDAYEGNLNGNIIEKTITKIGHVLNCFIPFIIGFVCQLVCMLIVTTNTLNICIRGFFVPLAIPQLFEEGMRSSGVKYIKSFAAYCIEMAVIVITLRLSSHVANYIQTHLYNWECQIFSSNNGVTVFNASNIDAVLGFSQLIPAIIPMLTAIVGIGGASKVTHEITGA